MLSIIEEFLTSVTDKKINNQRMVLAAGDEIQFTLVKGEKLKAADSNNLSDPFVTMEASTGKKFKSKTIHDNLNPVWNESFTFTLEKSENFMLSLQVFDLDVIKNVGFIVLIYSLVYNNVPQS